MEHLLLSNRNIFNFQLCDKISLCMLDIYMGSDVGCFGWGVWSICCCQTGTFSISSSVIRSVYVCWTYICCDHLILKKDANIYSVEEQDYN